MATRSREANRAYMREYRRRKAAEKRGEVVTEAAGNAVASVTSLDALRHDVQSGSGGLPESVSSAVCAELVNLPAAGRRPADAAVALAMAKILDDSDSIPQQPAAAARLRGVMESLRSEGESGKSKLSTLRAARGN